MNHPVMIGEPNGPTGKAKAKFRCECGNEFVARTDHVKSGATRSCGCAILAYRSKLAIPQSVPEIDIDNESWLPVPGHEGMYEASNQGRVRSIPRVVRVVRYGEEHLRRRKMKVLKQTNHHKGYFVVSLGSNNCTLEVHKIIARTFLGDPDGMTVDHKNGNKHDNRLRNLEYVSGIENSLRYHRRAYA